MNNQPLISIVVPVYNRSQYIEKCLNSIIAQVFRDFEVIIIDDGSQDGSERIIDEYANHYEYIYAYHKKNEGVIAARKEGTNRSNGRYIINLDSDDFLQPSYLESIATEIQKHNSDIVVTGMTYFNVKGRKERFQGIKAGFYNRKMIEQFIIPNIFSIEPFYSFGILPSLCVSCIKKDIIWKNQKSVPNSFSIGDDLAVFYPCIIQCDSMSIISDTGYNYVIHNESLTHIFDPDFSDKIIMLFSYLEKVLPIQDYLKEQFLDYVVFEVSLLIGNYLGQGLNHLEYKSSVNSIKKVMDLKIVKKAFEKKRFNRRKIGHKWMIKVFLIRNKLLYSYHLLARI